MWVPVAAARRRAPKHQEVVLPSEGVIVEAATGMWSTGDSEGIVFVYNPDVFEQPLDPGMKVAELQEAVVQTRVCTDCGVVDTDALPIGSDLAQCQTCAMPISPGPSTCKDWKAGPAKCEVLSYTGCQDCRPEAKLRQRGVRPGPAASILLRAQPV